MKGQRTERIARMVSNFFMTPSKPVSVTELAEKFSVSKTVVSDDMEVVASAFAADGFGAVQVERGRSGGARFLPECTPEYRRAVLEETAEKLSDPDRYLPGGLIYYNDLIFDPVTALPLGLSMASLFVDAKPDIIVTTEVKGIPVALFTAYALGCPLTVCRFRNRPSDGAAMAVHYPAANGEVRTMYMGTKQIQKGSRVLILDDFMRGGSTAAGMQLMAKHFEAEIVGTGLFITADKPQKKAVSGYKTLLRLTESEGAAKLSVACGD